MLTNNYRCITIPGPGIVARWPDEILLCVGPIDVLEELVRQATGDSIALRMVAASINWWSNGGGYVSLRDTSGGLVVEGDGFCDAVIDEKRLPVANTTTPGGSVSYFLDRRAATPLGQQPLDPYLNLSHGLVRGSGLILIPTKSPASQETGHTNESDVPVRAAVDTQIVETPSKSRNESSPQTLGAKGPVSLPMDNAPVEAIELEGHVEYQPLPLATKTGENESGTEGRAIVRGRACPVNHVNHPEAQYCMSCGRALNATQRLIDGHRPSLGSILFDDGSRHDLVMPTRVGRDPARSEGYETIALDNDDISRQHLTIDLQNWDVLITDNGSANKTYAREFDREDWRELRPDVPLAIQPGTVIRLGEVRQFTFQATHALPPPSR